MVKREVPTFLQWLLKKDAFMTGSFVKYTDKIFGPLTKYDKWMKRVEISCHGIPWLFVTATMMFLFESIAIRQFAVNIFLALILDIIIVAVIKSIVRRRRPSGNKDDMFITIAVDKFSFPSGHATRVVMLSLVLSLQYNLIFPLPILLLGWSVTVCISRVLLRRHHVLDVIGGVLIGIVEAYLVYQLFWLHEDSTQAVIHFFIAEKGVGDSYDV